MRRLIVIWGVLLSLTMTSCIDIIDEIVLNKDKSGKVFIGLQSQMLASVMSAARQELGPEMAEQLQSFPAASAEKLKDIKGIHEVNAWDVISEGRLGIAFSFDNPKALNRAYYRLMDMEKKWYHPKIVKIGRHHISRRNITPQLIEQLEENNPDIAAAPFIKYLNIRTVLRLPAEAKSVKSDKKAKVTDTGVQIHYSFQELLQQDLSTAYKVRF